MKLRELHRVIDERTVEGFPFRPWNSGASADLFAGLILAYYTLKVITVDEALDLYMELSGESPQSTHFDSIKDQLYREWRQKGKQHV